MTNGPIHIDGSFGEGGGQILRTSLSLSCITGRPFELVNIRANRPKPGLRPQHLQCVKAAAAICGATVAGADVGSMHITFEPGAIRPGEYRFDIGTAGSTCLVLQTVVYPLSFASAGSEVVITGGTHNPMAPCFHYLDRCWGPQLNSMGFRVDLRMIRAGFYPQGGGEIRARISPAAELQPVVLAERGKRLRVDAVSGVANLKRHILQRQAKQAGMRLNRMGIKCRVQEVDMPAVSQGTFVMVNAKFDRGRACYVALGAIRKPAERVADEACRAMQRFLDNSTATVDEHLADQILIPCAFAPGESVFRTPEVTTHLATNAQVIRRFHDVEIAAGEVGEESDVQVIGKSPPCGTASPDGARA